MRVDAAFIHSVLFPELLTEGNGEPIKPFVRDNMKFLHSEKGLKNAKKWFSVHSKDLAKRWSEHELLEFLRQATSFSVPDYQILDIFDFLDFESDGMIGFDEFFLVVAMLVAIQSGQTTRFLHMHGKAFFERTAQQSPNGTLSYEQFSRLGIMMGFSDALMLGILSAHGVTELPEHFRWEDFQLHYFIICKAYDSSGIFGASIETSEQRKVWERQFSSVGTCKVQ